MKKNSMMRIAALLLALTLMTSCFVGGTFAKYTTAGNKALETARVAHWGVTIDVSGDDAFAKNYKDAATDVAAEITVASSTVDKVVAPGTNGTLFTMNVEGSPEVDTQITITADLELVGWVDAGGDFYCPIVFNINGTSYAWLDSYASLDEFEAVVENAITAQAGTYQANADLSTVLDDTITWSWAFRTGDDDAEKAANDIKDTYLGDCAAGIITGKTASTISLTMSITIEQVD